MLRCNKEKFIKYLPLTKVKCLYATDRINERTQWKHMYAYSTKAYMTCHYYFFDWGNTIACDHVNIPLISHNKQKLQEPTQVKMTVM